MLELSTQQGPAGHWENKIRDENFHFGEKIRVDKIHVS